MPRCAQKGQQIDLKSDPANAAAPQGARTRSRRRSWSTRWTKCCWCSAAKELGYKLSDEQFKGVLDNIKKENKLETEEQFQAALKAESITIVDLRRNLERSMLVQRVQQNEVMRQDWRLGRRGAQATTSHISTSSRRSSRSRCREILVALPADDKGLNVAADEAAKTKAERHPRTRDDRAASFEKLAADVSDAPSKANAGLIGPISLNDHRGGPPQD